MSIADAALFRDLTARVERLEALLGIEATGATTDGPEGVSPIQRSSIEMGRVVDALSSGQSVRTAAQALGLSAAKVGRLRQRAVAEGRLPRLSRVSSADTAAPAGPSASADG
jgi:hypothetical protein